MKRPTVLVLALALCQLAPGQDLYKATKADPAGLAASQSAGSGLLPLLQMLLALGVVLALLKFALPRIVGRFGKRLSTSVGSGIRVEESATFPGGSLYIVSARGRSLLLCVGSSGVTNLADLTETFDASGTKAPTQTFLDYLEREAEPRAAIRTPSSDLPSLHPSTPPSSAATPDPDRIEAVLRRLERIAP